MKNRFITFSLLLALLASLGTEQASAQAKKPQRTSNKRTTTTKPKTTVKTNNANNAALSAPVVVDTPKKLPPPPPPEPDLKLAPLTPSLRNDNAFERNLVKERIPLNYEHIREDDAAYVERVWRELDVHEKMNVPFVYKAEGELGNQRFITLLLSAIKSGEVTAFNQKDDRFSTPVTFKEIANSLVSSKSISVPDMVNDPDGSKGITRDTIIQEEFNPDNIERYWIKEDWIFDKESSRMYVRILGIAPLKTVKGENGEFRAVTPLFWVYYPDLRPMLAKHEVYNGKNFGARMSWEELFESRMFSSRIIKSTINNPNDLAIKDYLTDPILALLEGENIKEKIFSYEQDLWSY
jgi:gliding motility associated protien GldN